MRRTFGDAVFCREKPLLQETLEDGANRWPVDQLKHKQVGLQHTHRKQSKIRNSSPKSVLISSDVVLTQQQAVTVIWMVFLPGWHTCFRCKGLWEVLLSPLSMVRGVALTLTCTDAGQLVFICLSSWW